MITLIGIGVGATFIAGAWLAIVRWLNERAARRIAAETEELRRRRAEAARLEREPELSPPEALAMMFYNGRIYAGWEGDAWPRA